MKKMQKIVVGFVVVLSCVAAPCLATPANGGKPSKSQQESGAKKKKIKKARRGNGQGIFTTTNVVVASAVVLLTGGGVYWYLNQEQVEGWLTSLKTTLFGDSTNEEKIEEPEKTASEDAKKLRKELDDIKKTKDEAEKVRKERDDYKKLAEDTEIEKQVMIKAKATIDKDLEKERNHNKELQVAIDDAPDATKFNAFQIEKKSSDKKVEELTKDLEENAKQLAKIPKLQEKIDKLKKPWRITRSALNVGNAILDYVDETAKTGIKSPWSDGIPQGAHFR